MIYIIDEQINRQKEYSWTKEDFAQYDAVVKTIHRKDDFSEDILIDKKNIIFLHESFPDKNTKEKIYQRNKEKAISIGVFSGSKNERRKSENRIDLPVDLFYKNLTVFLDRVKEGDLNIGYLLYGASPEREQQLLSELEKRNNEEDDLSPISSNHKNLLFLTSENYIDNPFEDAPEVTLYEDEEKGDFSDNRLHTIVREELDGDKYDNIFIPLCFGNSLSDYNGLRLAAHIRCTKTINQLSNIYIYAFVGYKDLLEHPCFNILKTKNVFLIDYSKKAIQEADKNTISSLKEDELTKEIQKLALTAPKDNHTVANEWGIYQIVCNVGIKIEDIIDFDKNKINSLYFKWLIAKNRLFESIPEFQKQEQREYRYRLETNFKPTGEKIDLSKFSPKKENKQEKILLIDDFADKGWKQVLEETVTKKPIDIAENIEKAKEKIKERYDLIFLDMRLGRIDHENNNVEEFGGFKILQEIKSDFKNTNFSTPIILITASNKIWNIDRFKEYGVDFYYIKEHPNYVYSENYSIENFKRLKNDFKRGKEYSERRYEIWKLCKGIIERIEQHPYFMDKDERYSNVKKRIIDKIKLGYYYLFKESTEMEKEKLLANNESIAFIIFWSILEEIVKGYTDIDETWSKVRNEKGEIEYKWTGNWKFLNGEDFILDKKEAYQNKMISNKQERESKQDQKEDHKIYQEEKHINLSGQMYALLNCYILDNRKQKGIRNKFKEINEYRNQIDYIHSSVLSIFTQKLIDPEQTKKCFKKNEEVLHFIISILENCQ